MKNLITITFSAFNTFKKAFEPLFAPVSIDDLTDDDIQNVMITVLLQLLGVKRTL